MEGTTGMYNMDLQTATRDGIGRSTGRRQYLKGLLATGFLGTGLFSTKPAAGQQVTDEGGPVVLMGLDSELGPSDTDHGPPLEHATMVESILEDVTNGGDGILVIGASGTSPQTYWETDIGENVEEEVTFVNGPQNIREQDFTGYAMLGVASSDVELFGGGGLTDDENEALIERGPDVAAFVNDGGGLLGKTQTGLTNAWAYADPLRVFDTRTGLSYSSIDMTSHGEELGLTESGMSGWCCWHDTFVEFPDIYDVIALNDAGGRGGGEPAAIGGAQIVLIADLDLRFQKFDPYETGEPQEGTLRLRNGGDPTEENVEIALSVTSGCGADPEDVELERYNEDDDEWVALAFEETDGTLETTIENGDGFEVPHRFDRSIDLRVTFDTEDVFRFEAEVVGVDDGEHYAEAIEAVPHRSFVDLPELLEEKSELIDSIRSTAGQVLGSDVPGFVPNAAHLDPEDLDEEAERVVSDLEGVTTGSPSECIDDENVDQYVEAMERLVAIEQTTATTAEAPIRDVDGNGSIIERQIQAVLDALKTLAFEAVSRGAGRVVRSSRVQSVADDIVRGTLREVRTIRNSYMPVTRANRFQTPRDENQAVTFDELDEDLQSDVLQRQRNRDMEFLDGGASALAGGSLSVADDMVDTFDDTVSDVRDYFVRLQYEQYLDGSWIGNPTDVLEDLASYEPPTLDLSDVPSSVEIPFAEEIQEGLDRAKEESSGFVDSVISGATDVIDEVPGGEDLREMFSDELSDRIEDLRGLVPDEVSDAAPDFDFVDIPTEIDIPVLEDLPDTIDLGDLTGVDEIQSVLDAAAEATARHPLRPLNGAVDQLVETVESLAEDDELDLQSEAARERVNDLAESITSGVNEFTHTLMNGLDTIGDYLDIAGAFTGVLLIAAALIGLIATGGAGSVVGVTVLGLISLVIMALSLVVEKLSIVIGQGARKLFLSIHNTSGGLVAETDLSMLDGGA